MSTPARILRATADSHHQRPELSPRQLACEERILAVSQTVMAVHGRDTISFTTMALALRMVRSTLRHYFCDLDVLLSEILRRHLRRLAYAIGDVPTPPRTARDKCAPPTSPPPAHSTAASPRPTPPRATAIFSRPICSPPSRRSATTSATSWPTATPPKP